MKITEAGYYPDVPMMDYVGDCAPEPSLSTGIVQALTDQSPLHAWQMHPKLGGLGGGASSRGDLGSAIHAAVLGGAPIVYAPAEFADWRKKDAQAFRDEAREAGSLPLLAEQRACIEAASGNARKVLEQFGPGENEMTMAWQEANGVWCRGRADFISNDGRYDVDLKSTNNASPREWIKTTLLRGGYSIQAALRARGHLAMTGRARDVVFLVVEIEPPYAASLVGLEPALADFADCQVQRAIKIWGECLKTNVWPGYRPAIHYAELPAWAEFDMGAA